MTRDAAAIEPLPRLVPPHLPEAVFGFLIRYDSMKGSMTMAFC
jgi:hypothetical protein